MDSPELPNIMSVRELIDAAFGDQYVNVVNHKLLQTVLVILAKQLRLLERRVEVVIGPFHGLFPRTSLSVTEVKMHANVSKKKKFKPGQSGKAKKAGGASAKDKSSTDKSSTDKSSDKKSSSSTEPLPQSRHSILDAAETSREKELRVIRQRADSREEHDRTPTPMASLTSTERQYEKLLIVERVPTQDAKLTDSQSRIRGRTPSLSVVTKEEYDELVKVVQELQRKLVPVGTPGFPENIQLYDDLRKGASLTDAMAALQLSARLEAAENALEKMLSLVTDLASKTPDLHVEANKQNVPSPQDKKETEVIFSTGTESRVLPSAKTKKTVKPSKNVFESTVFDQEPTKSKMMEVEKKDSETRTSNEEQKNWITAEEMDDAMDELYNELMKVVNNSTTNSNANANQALKIAQKLEIKLDDAMNLGDRMIELENIVAVFAEQINTLDTGLSSQMTNYQEQLTQMQHDLEVGIETMQEALANTGGDTAGIAELNNQFSSLQMDFETAAIRQKELKDALDLLSLDLSDLWKQIEVLRDTKSDRDEVADALRDKAGLADLNGLVSRLEFNAVQGDIQKRIGTAYHKFNNQEIVWQKAIDELIRELNEKADKIQLFSLQDSITRYLDKLRGRIKDIMDIVGEPRSAAVSRKLHRDTACLSCATPAQMDTEENPCFPKIPALPSRPPAVGAEAKTKPKEDGDGVCYPGLPVPHAIDQRAHTCQRYCGGSHTLLSGLSRAPAGMIINPIMRQVNTEVGTDGKVYLVDNNESKKPCLPCNLPKPSFKQPCEVEPAQDVEEHSSGMTPSDLFEAALPRRNTEGAEENVSLIPPMSD